MSYYQGDFYEGDPGFFSAFGKLAGLGASFMPGVGGIVSKGVGILSKLKKTRAGAAIVAHPTLSAAATAGTIGAVGGGMAAHAPSGRMGRGVALMPAGGMPMRGFHISKHSGKLVRNRRMRVTNPKALRRAIRRAKGFERLARKVMHFVSPRHVKGRGVFRVRRRK